jgi:acyl-CoA reductase-like NAD-dependent aldehyde dehydrogenase
LHRAGVPASVIQAVHLSPELTEHVIQHKSIGFVSFTGSVAGGASVEKAAVASNNNGSFTGVALEVRIISPF